MAAKCVVEGESSATIYTLDHTDFSAYKDYMKKTKKPLVFSHALLYYGEKYPKPRLKM